MGQLQLVWPIHSARSSAPGANLPRRQTMLAACTAQPAILAGACLHEVLMAVLGPGSHTSGLPPIGHMGGVHPP